MTTASAAELAPKELRAGRDALQAKVARHRPRAVAILGITAYRAGFVRPHATLGRQPEDLAGVTMWVLPNPSGLNAHHQLDDLTRRFRALRLAVGVSRRQPVSDGSDASPSDASRARRSCFPAW